MSYPQNSCPTTGEPEAPPEQTHITFIVPQNQPDVPRSSRHAYLRVCSVGCGSNGERCRRGVTDPAGTPPGMQPGCTAAPFLCAGLGNPQAMLQWDDTKSMRINNKSNVGSIRVPCGVDVTAYYGPTCDKQYVVSDTIPSTNVPFTFPRNSPTDYPYAFKVALQSGFKCFSDGNVKESSSGNACGGGTDSPAAGPPATPPTHHKHAPFTPLEIGIGVALLVLVAAALLVAAPSSQPAPLSVNQIVASSGVNEHLVAPT